MNIISLFLSKIYLSKLLRNILLLLFVAIVMMLYLRGIPGNPTETELNLPIWRDDGPFELSPERGRYALLYSWFENNTNVFTVPIARFVLPDVGYKDGKYVSLFAPGVSFIAIPGYLIGKEFNLAQVGSFAVIVVFAVVNFFLIKSISMRLKATESASIIAAMIFLFATPAFAYGVSLYQHHISTFLLLLCIYVLLRWNNFWSLAVLWFLCGASISIDNPNFFMMLPLGIYGLSRIIKLKAMSNKIKVNILPYRLLAFITMVVPLAMFMWFNQVSNGSPFKLSGSVSSISAIDEIGRPITEKDRKLLTEKDLDQNKEVGKFFNTRNMVNGVYEHFFSLDRGMVIYTPVMFYGFMAFYVAYKKKTGMLAVMTGVMAMNMLLYAMWGDPYGGWAFGTRYLIPSYAILAIFISILLTNYKRNTLFLVAFGIIASYSILINSLGALTSSKNPPQKEISYLESVTKKREHFTYERNIEYLNAGIVKSFIYTTYAYEYFTPRQYYLLLTFILSGFFSFWVIYLRSFSKTYEK
jgi:hypothetical protein